MRTRKIISSIILCVVMMCAGIATVSMGKQGINEKQTIKAQLYEHWEPMFPPWMDEPWQFELDCPVRNDTWWGMSFMVGASGPNVPHWLYSFKLPMVRYSNMYHPGIITLKVYRADSAGNPTGKPLCTGSFNSMKLHVSLPFKYFEVLVYPWIRLQKNTQYCFILHGTQTDEIELQSYMTEGWYYLPDGSAVYVTIPIYSGGTMLYSGDGVTWTQLASQPIVFQEYGIH